MSISFDAHMILRGAGDCYSKSGCKVISNDVAPRLHFNIFNYETTKFDISCYKIKPLNFETITVRVNLYDKDLYLNLAECAARLQFSEKKLRKNCEPESFKAFWDQKLKQTLLLEKINNHYHSILGFYDENKDQLIAKKTMNVPIFRKAALMKIIRIFHDELQYRKLPTVFEIDIRDKHITKYSLEKMHNLTAAATIREEYYLVNETLKEKIARGSYGVVFKIDNLSLGTFAALKESRVDYVDDEDGEAQDKIERAYKNVQDEYYVLHNLYEMNIKKNIVPPPYFSFKEDPPKIYSYVGYFYNSGDLFDTASNFPLQSRAKIFGAGLTGLIYALALFHAKNMFDNDVKPENIFVEIDEDVNYTLHFGDLTTLRKANDISQEFESLEHTPIYSPYNPFNKKHNYQELQSFDVYQLGATFYWVLTECIPYIDNTLLDVYPDFTVGLNLTRLAKYCSFEAVALLARMLHPDEAQRYKMEDVVKHIEKPGFTWEKV